MRLINADVLLNNLRALEWITDDINNDTNVLQDIIEDMPTVNAIIIPNNATNGDMIKALFPSCETRQPIAIEDIVEITLDRIIGITVTLDWWNAPYKRSE